MNYNIILILNLITWGISNGQYGENFNSCVESCANEFDYKYSVNLNENNTELFDDQLIEILDENNNNATNCSKNILLRIPFSKLKKDVIVKLELEYADFIEGTTIHIGNSPTNDLNGGDRNSTIFNTEVYSKSSNFYYYMNSVYLCDQSINNDLVINEDQLSNLLLLNESFNLLTPKSKIVIYVGEKWFRIDNLDTNTSLYYNNKYMFTFNDSSLSEQCKDYSTRESPYLYIGLNRVIADSEIEPGKGLCQAKISFLNCFINPEPDMKINVKEMRYTYGDSESLFWVTPLSYIEQSSDHLACSAQGVIKIKFDPISNKKIARFDLEFGEDVSGYSFNIGDSPTNNGFGGDSGSTSNSAEVHTNDNKFYVWLNTKYCGDTLLYKVEYNLIESFDNLTIFVSDQRIELKNSRGFHQIYKHEYLYQLSEQNVTCNCFDTRCYPGVRPDNNIYFSINRVIGGSFRPGFGLCHAKISWLQCNKNIKNDIASLESDIPESKLTKRHLRDKFKGRPLMISSSEVVINQTNQSDTNALVFDEVADNL